MGSLRKIAVLGVWKNILMHEALRRSLMNWNISLFGVSLLAAIPLNDVVAKWCTFHNFESNPRSPRNLPWVRSLALRFRSRTRKHSTEHWSRPCHSHLTSVLVTRIIVVLCLIHLKAFLSHWYYIWLTFPSTHNVSPSLQRAVARRSLAAAAPAARAAPPMTRHLWTPQRHKAQDLTSSELGCQLSVVKAIRTSYVHHIFGGSFIHFDQLSTPLFFKAFRPPFCYAFQKKGATCTTSQFQISCVFFCTTGFSWKSQKASITHGQRAPPKSSWNLLWSPPGVLQLHPPVQSGSIDTWEFSEKKVNQQKSNGTVDGEIQTTTWDVLKNLINNGINYIPQLVSRISSIKSMTQTFPDWCRTSYEIICLTMVHKPKHITNRRIKHRKIPKITTYIYYICKSILQKLWISWLIADLTVASFLPMVFTLPETNSEFTPENGWLEYTIISFWDGPFSSWPYP